MYLKSIASYIFMYFVAKYILWLLITFLMQWLLFYLLCSSPLEMCLCWDQCGVFVCVFHHRLGKQPRGWPVETCWTRCIVAWSWSSLKKRKKRKKIKVVKDEQCSYAMEYTLIKDIHLVKGVQPALRTPCFVQFI